MRFRKGVVRRAFDWTKCLPGIFCDQHGFVGSAGDYRAGGRHTGQPVRERLRLIDTGGARDWSARITMVVVCGISVSFDDTRYAARFSFILVHASCS